MLLGLGIVAIAVAVAILALVHGKEPETDWLDEQW